MESGKIPQIVNFKICIDPKMITVKNLSYDRLKLLSVTDSYCLFKQSLI